MKFLTFLLLVLYFNSSFAEKQGIPFIKTVLAKYQAAPGVEIAVRKTITLGLLEETKKSEGTLLVSKGKLRLDIESPEKSQVVMNKSNIWVISPTPKELGGKNQVLKISSASLSGSAKAPLAFLLGESKAWDKLKVKKSTAQGEIVKIELVPIEQSGLGEITTITIKVNKTKLELIEISYFDELENQTQYEFVTTNFSAKVCDSQFTYTPNKNSQVTEYK